MHNVSFGKNLFCGPSAVSAIAGITTDEAASILSRITGKRKITGVYLDELKKAFEFLGYKVQDQNLSARTVYGCLFGLRTDGYYVFMVPRHFIAIEVNGSHKYICDNHSKNPINASSSARLGDKAIACFRIVKD